MIDDASAGCDLLCMKSEREKGKLSVGVARQYCGQLGKQENCQVAVSLSVANEFGSLPIAYRLYLPEVWAKDHERRKVAKVPEDIEFLTKPQIALLQIEQAVKSGITATVLADAGYGNDSKFREGITDLGLQYAVPSRKADPEPVVELQELPEDYRPRGAATPYRAP